MSEKKGLSTAAWVAIGCGGLIFVGLLGTCGLGWFALRKGKEMVTEATGASSFEEFVQDMQENPARTAAEAMISLNPELEIVSTDDDAGTITFVNTRTGEEATLDFEDIAEGRFSMRTDEGEFRVDADQGDEGGLTVSGPDGQETRFGASAELDAVPDWVLMYPGATSSRSLYHTVAPAGVSGIVVQETGDGAQKVIDFYREGFADAGWTVSSQSMTTTGGSAYGGIVGQLDGRSLNVSVGEDDGTCKVTINYNGKA